MTLEVILSLGHDWQVQGDAMTQKLPPDCRDKNPTWSRRPGPGLSCAMLTIISDPSVRVTGGDHLTLHTTRRYLVASCHTSVAAACGHQGVFGGEEDCSGELISICTALWRILWDFKTFRLLCLVWWRCRRGAPAPACRGRAGQCRCLHSWVAALQTTDYTPHHRHSLHNLSTNITSAIQTFLPRSNNVGF